jgi:hypothetical protein
MDNESFMEIDVWGIKSWKNKEDKFHRLDGPAKEWPNGNKEWYKDGKLHRLDGPAKEWPNGRKGWFKNGKLHRLDGPAIECLDSAEYWYNGKLHRIDGPAVISQNGGKAWCKNGRTFKNKDTFFRSLNKKEKEIALFSQDFLNG